MLRELMVSACALGLLLAACGDEDRTQVVAVPEPGNGDETAGGGAGGSGGAGSEPECVENPVTHLEIINACTTAVKIKKTPSLTLLNADGSLPPL